MSSDNGEKCKQQNKSEKSKKSKSKHKQKHPILDIDVLKKYSIDQLLEYITKLHLFLEKREKKISKYKEKLKKFDNNKKVKETATEQTAIISSTNSNECCLTKTESVEEETKEPANFLDEIRQAAELAQNETGFIYEPISGLYYDQKTGYYYNAEYGLYYDGNNGCYYKLNPDTNQFVLHSRAEVVQQSSSTSEKAVKDDHKTYHNYSDDDKRSSDNDYDNRYYTSSRKNRKKKSLYENHNNNHHHHRRKIIKYNEFEDGEILSESSDDEGNKYDSEKCEDIAKKYPPSLRIIVQESNLDKVQVGTLYIITYKGGTLGREGNHDVTIPDINISKFHMKFSYDEEKSIYQCIDLGSRNGTILNGKRMSTAKQESELMNIDHGSIIQLSQTKLLCHIHAGNTTCNLCEPGLLMEPKAAAVEEKVVTLSHKEQLKKLQKRYGLENEKYVEAKMNSKYNDRAAVRRTKVGSSSQHEKTQMASTEIAISSQNKGFKMLSKLGWNEGETLGKKNSGLLEPIDVTGNSGKKGLGCEKDLPTAIVSKTDLKKAQTWRKTQERYNKLSKADIFHDSSDSSD